MGNCSMGIGFSFGRRKSSRHLLHNNVNIVNTTVHLKMAEGTFYITCFLPN